MNLAPGLLYGSAPNRGANIYRLCFSHYNVAFYGA